mgnify:CR=1 FL=1
MKHRNDLYHEVEVKFYLSDKTSFEDRLRRIGGDLIHERVLEKNYRFDTPDLALSREHRVLRLRQDDAAIITYKGPSTIVDGVVDRQEIEFTVSDFNAARQLLESLGYQQSISYEKWRTTYQLDELEITLDEMPFGNFTEIEGGDAKAIQSVARKLALEWTTGITESYLMLFDRVKKQKMLELHDLTFAAFHDLQVTPQDLGVKPADTPLFL